MSFISSIESNLVFSIEFICHIPLTVLQKKALLNLDISSFLILHTSIFFFLLSKYSIILFLVMPSTPESRIFGVFMPSLFIKKILLDSILVQIVFTQILLYHTKLLLDIHQRYLLKPLPVLVYLNV